MTMSTAEKIEEKVAPLANLEVKYKRVLLKMSGEILMGDREYGIDPATLERIARDVKEVIDMGVEVCIVVGAGNIFRGVAGEANGMERVTADYVGMLGTVMNALSLQSAFEGIAINNVFH